MSQTRRKPSEEDNYTYLGYFEVIQNKKVYLGSYDLLVGGGKLYYFSNCRDEEKINGKLIRLSD